MKIYEKPIATRLELQTTDVILASVQLHQEQEVKLTQLNVFEWV